MSHLENLDLSGSCSMVDIHSLVMYCNDMKQHGRCAYVQSEIRLDTLGKGACLFTLKTIIIHTRKWWTQTPRYAIKHMWREHTLKIPVCLLCLHLPGNNIGDRGTVGLVEAFKYIHNLEYLNLDCKLLMGGIPWLLISMRFSYGERTW